MLKVGTIVRLRNCDEFRNTFGVISEVNKNSGEYAVTIYDKNDEEYDNISWLEEDEDFIVCPQYSIHNMPKNLDFNFIALDVVDFGCNTDFDYVSLDEHERYLNELLSDEGFMTELNEYDQEWLESFKNGIIKSKEDKEDSGDFFDLSEEDEDYPFEDVDIDECGYNPFSGGYDYDC